MLFYIQIKHTFTSVAIKPNKKADNHIALLASEGEI